MIIVRANLGLANRMRVINSSILLSKYLNTGIKLIWEKNAGLNCDFLDLFMPIENLEIIQKHKVFNFYTAPKPTMLIFYRRFFKHILNKYYLLNNTYFNEDAVINKRFDDNYWKKLKGNILIDTCHDFFTQTEANNLYYLFKPGPDLQNRINELSAQFNEYTIGVHIRRTDNEKAIENSREEDFIIKLKDLIKKEPLVNFYLSTDDIKTELLFKTLFANYIKTQPGKVFYRDTSDGIQHALVDMYTLANTTYIIGSWWSSFNIIASNLGKNKLEIIK